MSKGQGPNDERRIVETDLLELHKLNIICVCVCVSQVPICGNNSAAKERVSSLIRSLGMVPQDYGSLNQAGELEDIPFRRFPEWKAPLIFTSLVLMFFYLVLLFRYVICDRKLRYQSMISCLTFEVKVSYTTIIPSNNANLLG